MSGKLFIISAPSGAGKTSLVDNLLPKLQKDYSIDRLVTYTSRNMRPGEAEGVDFNYISGKEFEKKIKEGFFVEWSKAYDNYYGSPSSVIQDIGSGKSKILVIDQVGAKKILGQMSDAVPIWIYTPTIDILRQRLLSRGHNSLDEIERRIKRATFELKEEAKNRFYKYHILNDIFDDAAKNLELILVKELKSF